MTAYYNSSRGPVLIKDMVWTHLNNAYDKLKRDRDHAAGLGAEWNRHDELAAMNDEIERRHAEHQYSDEEAAKYVQQAHRDAG